MKKPFYVYKNLILGLPKSISLSLKYFKLKDAIKLPILVSYKTKILVAKGKIVSNVPIKTGLLKIGINGIRNK